MGKQHQAVKFKDIAEKLPELEGKNLEEIAGVLGYRNLDSCKVNLYNLRQKAEHDGLKALDRIPDKYYALLYDMMEG